MDHSQARAQQKIVCCAISREFGVSLYTAAL
jgi:hypothetical protein